uniref:non-specific serine/threonine protein kinase n=1 Tax=Meloidogyne incognita TaxID=6306 RepID=A0A914MZV2_MELIC
MNPQNEQLNNYFYNQHQSSPYLYSKPALVPATSIYDFYSLFNIGSGAFAQVYRGYELIKLAPAKYREVALKRINLAAITDPAIYKTTINEVKIFTNLNHQNIVKCFRSFEEISRYSQNKYLVLVLEYVNGGDLQSLIQERATTYSCLLHESEIWFLFGQIAGAVKYIHSKRIIHRDLKPPNVLLTDNGIVKLADFGLSRLNLPVGYQAQTVCGTPYYMSPERIIEEPYTFASDIWSLGCILYEMAATKSPFFGEKDNVQSLIQKIQTADYPPIPDDRYTPHLEFLIESCMRPTMNERPNAFTVYEVAEYMNGLWQNH